MQCHWDTFLSSLLSVLKEVVILQMMPSRQCCAFTSFSPMEFPRGEFLSVEPQPHYLFPSVFTVFHLGSVSTVFLQFCRAKGEILRKTYEKGAFQVWNRRLLFLRAHCLAGGQFCFLCAMVHQQKCVKAMKECLLAFIRLLLPAESSRGTLLSLEHLPSSTVRYLGLLLTHTLMKLIT